MPFQTHESTHVQAVLLGTAQDGGVPHADCTCRTCAAARQDPRKRQFASCLGLADHGTRQCWLIDATPDFPSQLHALINQTSAVAPGGDADLRPLRQAQDVAQTSGLRLSGILLTHAHIGHYTGLIYLGAEVMNTGHMPVYCTEQMATFLMENAPWSGLVQGGNINLHLLEIGSKHALTPDLSFTPLLVPHRGEYSDTVAFWVKGPSQSLVYCPDIDSWDNVQLPDTEIALLDGSFYSPAELPGRALSQIPHPFVSDSVEHFQARTAKTEIDFIHLNHSNILWHLGPERQELTRRGFGVGVFGQSWTL